MAGLELGPTREDKRIGMILGLAVGDALGSTYEFCSPEDVPEGPLEIVGGGWLYLDSGEITDDSALAKAVVEGYQEGSLDDLRRVRDAMLRWLKIRTVAIRVPPPHRNSRQRNPGCEDL